MSTPKLCSICSTQESKYRCPRHPQINTCSLPCTRRHRLRASCPGTRDPTSYIKKSSLSASSLDSDYNFLTSIDRALPSSSSSTGRPGKRARISSHLENYLRENGIDMRRAPEGMARAKENTTRWLPRAKRVAWSVEWIFPSAGERVVMEVWDDVVLDEALGRAVKRTEGKGVMGEVFLLRPGTRGEGKVLDRVEGRGSLTQALKGRRVDEFPTFYVMDNEEGVLGEGFEMGEVYDRRVKEGKVDGGREESEVAREEEDDPAWDEKRVLEMLRRDVDRLQR